MATIQWSRQVAGISIQQVQRAANQLSEGVDGVRDGDGNGQLTIDEVKTAQTTQAVKAKLMGLHASAVGFIHHDPTRDEMKETLQRGLDGVTTADQNRDGTLGVEELRTLRNLNQTRLVELGWQAEAPLAPQELAQRWEQAFDEMVMPPASWFVERAPVGADTNAGARLAQLRNSDEGLSPPEVYQSPNGSFAIRSQTDGESDARMWLYDAQGREIWFFDISDDGTYDSQAV